MTDQMIKELTNRMACDIRSAYIGQEDGTGISKRHFDGMYDAAKILGLEVKFELNENHECESITVNGYTVKIW